LLRDRANARAIGGVVTIANPKAIQIITGHATIQMTFDHYGHLFPGGLREAAAAANNYLRRVVGTRSA
jgi:integrase